METADLAQLIKTRRSIHSFQDKPVAEAPLLKAIELATWAPNGSNRQSWRFYLIMNKEMINSIANTIELTMSRMMSRGRSVPPGGTTTSSPGGEPRSNPLRSAPVLIVVASQKYINPIIKMIEERVKNVGEVEEAKKAIDGLQIVNPRIQSVAAAIAYLVLVLHQMGLGSLWMTGPLWAKADIEKLLEIPNDLDIVALVPVGYAAENPVKDRKPVTEVCQVIR